MTFPRLLLAAILCCAASPLMAAPRDDLGSPSQQVRDEAAKVLRTSFRRPWRARWEPVLAGIKVGDSNRAVLEWLRPYHVTVEDGEASGQWSHESYRLDDVWIISCNYTGTAVLDAKLTGRLRYVWVAPPGDFTGVWTTYFVNGQRSHEIQYQGGQYSGTFTAFHADGSKLYVQHYGPAGVDGEDTGYFPSGRVMYRARYEKGAPTGTWTHYNEDGTVRSETKHPIGKP